MHIEFIHLVISILSLGIGISLVVLFLIKNKDDDQESQGNEGQEGQNVLIPIQVTAWDAFQNQTCKTICKAKYNCCIGSKDNSDGRNFGCSTLDIARNDICYCTNNEFLCNLEFANK